MHPPSDGNRQRAGPPLARGVGAKRPVALGLWPAGDPRHPGRDTAAALAAVGLPAVLAAGRLVRHQLVGVGAADLPTLAAAVVVLGATAAAAAYWPASRAARVAPQTALRAG